MKGFNYSATGLLLGGTQAVLVHSAKNSHLWFHSTVKDYNGPSIGNNDECINCVYIKDMKPDDIRPGAIVILSITQRETKSGWAQARIVYENVGD